MERGSVSWRVYLYYASNCGLPVVLTAACFALLYAGLQIGANFKLSEWADSGLGNLVRAKQLSHQW